MKRLLMMCFILTFVSACGVTFVSACGVTFVPSSCGVTFVSSSCGVTSSQPELQNVTEFVGYVADPNLDRNPVVFATQDSLIYLYDYEFDRYTARVERTVFAYNDNGRWVAIQ
jgi:hypothetical protein